MSRPSRRLFLTASLAAAASLSVGVPAARADMSKKVIAAFKGKILVTQGPLEQSGDDKSTIAAFKKAAMTTIKGEQNGNDVQEWEFNYTAFLTKPGATSLKLEFYNEAGQYVADQTLTDVDPKMTVLQGDISINEDDGLAKGKKYTIKLAGDVKGKEVIFASVPGVMMN
ncbi:MAG TPA: hypothetical protein VHE35_35250 [Kofleriaceae bacterium]|nr:hypothetical protein [Kofleriaceae bacterium]